MFIQLTSRKTIGRGYNRWW